MTREEFDSELTALLIRARNDGVPIEDVLTIPIQSCVVMAAAICGKPFAIQRVEELLAAMKDMIGRTEGSA